MVVVASNKDGGSIFQFPSTFQTDANKSTAGEVGAPIQLQVKKKLKPVSLGPVEDVIGPNDPSVKDAKLFLKRQLSKNDDDEENEGSKLNVCEPSSVEDGFVTKKIKMN